MSSSEPQQHPAGEGSAQADALAPGAAPQPPTDLPAGTTAGEPVATTPDGEPVTAHDPGAQQVEHPATRSADEVPHAPAPDATAPSHSEQTGVPEETTGRTVSFTDDDAQAVPPADAQAPGLAAEQAAGQEPGQDASPADTTRATTSVPADAPSGATSAQRPAADAVPPATVGEADTDPATAPAATETVAGGEQPLAPAPEQPAAEAAAPVKRTGSFEPYTIGDPGRAFTHAVSLTETKHRDAHDVVIDAATVPDAEGTPRLVLRAASSRGLAHQQYGDPRQDDHCTVLSRDGRWLVGLVADGVSAGEWSHLAAKMATEEGATQILSLLETHDPATIPYKAVFDRLADLLADVCATLPDSEPTVDLSPKDVARRMATTLVIAIIATSPGEDGTHEVTVVRLGDSSAWILDAEDGWIALGDVKNAGNVIAESATACLPLVPDADPVPVRTTLGAGGVLVLMTDGIGDPLGAGTGEVGRDLARLWARPPHPLEFAAQVAFGRKTFDDDRGAIAVWPVVPE